MHAHPDPNGAAPDAQRLAERLRAVASAAGRVAGAPSLEALRDALEAACREALPFDTLAVFTIDDGAGAPDDAPAAEVPWAEVREARRPLLTRRPEGEGPTSAILAPLRADDVLLGVLAVERTGPEPYGEGDVEVAEVAAALTAAALANRRLAEEGRAAERARRVLETRFRAMFEQFPLSVQIFAPDGRTLDVNRAWEALFRLPPEALEHFNPLHDPQLADVRDLLLRGFAGETVTIPAHPFDPSPLDGEASRARWLEVTVCPVRSPEGEVREVFVVHRDVTDRHVTEEALREREQQLREAQRIARLGSWRWDVDEDRFAWSDELYRIYGLEPQASEASFAAYLALVHPDDRAMVRTHIARARETGEPFAFEERVVRPDGAVRVLQSSGEVTRDADGRVTRLVGVCLDITELKEAEAALGRARDELERRVEERTAELAQAEARFRAIVEASPVPFILSRVEDGVILYANERLEALIGAEPGSLTGRHTPDFYYDPADRPGILQTVREQGYVRDLELRIRRADGTPRWVSLTVQRLLFNGEPALATALVDITERREAAEALRQRTLELEAIFRALPDLYFRMAADGTILDYRAGRAFGLYVPPEAFLGRPVQEVLPPAVGDQLAEALAEVARTGDLVQFEYTLPLDEEQRDFEARLLPLDGGQVIAVVRDVTEQREAAEALRASEASYRGLFDNLTELVYIQDLEGRFLNVNEAVVRAYGYARTELIGKTPDFLGVPGTVDPEAFAETFRKAVAGEPQRFEWLGRRKDGSTFLKEVAIQRSTYFGEDVVIAVARDVTERVEAEAALRRSEEHFRRLIENASDIITIIDPDGVVRYQSPAITRVLGYTPDELVGRNVTDYLPPEDVATTVENLRRVVEQPGKPVTAEFRFRHKDGSWRHLEGVGTTLSPDSPAEGIVVNSRDITERKEAERALRESEALKRGIVASALDCIISVDSDGRIVEFNPAAERTFGYRAEDVMGKPMAEFIVPPRLRAEHEAGMDRYRRTREAHVLGQRVEVPAVRADGTEFPIELAIDAVRLEDGREVFTAYLRDISERKAAEEALRASEEHFRLLIENSSDVATILDADGINRYQSPSIERVLGYEPEGLIGSSAFDRIHPEDVGRVRAVLGAAAASPGTTHVVEFRYRHRDGSWRVLEATGRTMLPDSAEAGVIVNSRDVTERVESERVLRFQKTLLEAEGEASIDGILVVGPDGKILSYNKQFVALWGIPPEVVASRSDEAAIGAVLDKLADPQAFLDRVAHLYAHPDETARDEIALKDGRVFDRYTAPVRSADGERYGRIWFFRDVTAERRHAEELDQARREAERAREQASQYALSLEHSLEELRAAQMHLVQQEKMASLGRLTAGIAHEIRNPLNFVNNFAALSAELAGELREALAPHPGVLDAETSGLLDALRENAEKIEEHGRRANAIVQGMLEHARSGAEERPRRRRSIDLNALVEGQVALSMEAHRAQGRTRGVRLLRDYGEDVGAVEADPEELGRVVHGLLANALDALDERAARAGESAAYVPTITIRTRREGGAVTVAVSDNGGGIPAEVRDRIFEPFFTTKPAGSGHPGLGLSLAHEIVVKGYGGWLDAESKEGAGATLTLTLPAP